MTTTPAPAPFDPKAYPEGFLREFITRLRTELSSYYGVRLGATCCFVENIAEDMVADDATVELITAAYRHHSGANGSRTGFKDINLVLWYDMDPGEKERLRIERLNDFAHFLEGHLPDAPKLKPLARTPADLDRSLLEEFVVILKKKLEDHCARAGTPHALLLDASCCLVCDVAFGIGYDEFEDDMTHLYRQHSGANTGVTGFKDIPTSAWDDYSPRMKDAIRVQRLTAFITHLEEYLK